MMDQTAYFKFAAIADHGLKILELPYQDGELSMLVLLPDATDGLAALEKKLTIDNVKAWTTSLRKQEVDVQLPKFRLESEFALVPTLQVLGMKAAFDPRQANFTGIHEAGELYVSDVRHKAFVDVNEEGTEAAAATGVVLGTTSYSESPQFDADHPFTIMIRDNHSGMILFLGRVTYPRS